MDNFGIMFHHFHDRERHIASQGSISGDEFRKMIEFLRADCDILDADVWYEKAIRSELEPGQICLTFDDALSCQYDIAYPILRELGIRAFWFIYTSIYEGTLEKLEIYRHFRFSKFDSVDMFYDFFFKAAVLNQDVLGIDVSKEIDGFDPNNYLRQFTFYTDSDKLFRYLRDSVLGQERYYFIMDDMINKCGYDMEGNKHLLWIKEEQLADLRKNNHLLGLHSSTHPTTMAERTYAEQLREYTENKRVLEKIISAEVFAVSYPCNSYNGDTDSIMNGLGIQLGFDAVMREERAGNLHFSRKDHAYVMKEMSK